MERNRRLVSVPLRGKYFETVADPSLSQDDLVVSVPLRGKYFETSNYTKSQNRICVSVPLRGKYFETLRQSKLTSVQMFPSPCGVNILKPLL